MTFSVGRLMDNCPHREGWESGNGEERCTRCGTRRFTDYGALRPPEVPQVVAPSPEECARADRAVMREPQPFRPNLAKAVVQSLAMADRAGSRPTRPSQTARLSRFSTTSLSWAGLSP